MKRSLFFSLILLLLAILSPAALFSGAGLTAYAAEHKQLEELPFSVDGRAPLTIRTIHDFYRNNRFVSLRDMAMAMKGTAKEFSLTIEDNSIQMTIPGSYTPAGGENRGFVTVDGETETPVSTYTTGSLGLHSMKLNGEEVRYHTYIGENAEKQRDAFIALCDLAMILDLDLIMEGGRLTGDSTKTYHIDLPAWRKEGFFDQLNSALVGDASNGAVYAEYHADVAVPIASTTKLMTLLIVMDALRAGEISMTDSVLISPEAAALSRTADGVILMDAGKSASLTDLLYGLMLPSSNESALALAEHLAGSEESFTERMNAKAKELGFSPEAVFYNCNGLPLFTDSVESLKIQNHLSARDMFLLVSHLLREYPEVLEITSTKEKELLSFGRSVKNTNPLLYNLTDVIGLKTGTTNASRSSLVSAAQAKDPEGNTHILVAIEYGAEDGAARNTISQQLLRYGLQEFKANPLEGTASPEEALPPAEALVRRILEGL